MKIKNYKNPRITSVHAKDGIIRPRIDTARSVTIPGALEICRKTGRLDAFKLDWKPGMPNQPHRYWDSDVAKVMEGLANILALYPDSKLEAEYDALVDLIVSAQQPDGYLNSYFTTCCPEERWHNTCNAHELYCAGHLIEAAVAGYELLGKTKFLKAMEKYADLIADTFGTEDGKKPGYPGHEELELALARLFNATGNEKYLKLAKYFIDQRGQAPNYYSEIEKTATSISDLIYRQAHMPLREQKDAVGHSVRAVYCYCGMADVARFTEDEELFQACERLFDSIANRRMYITGGIGSIYVGEAFSSDYDLPNNTVMYAESCAAIGLARFASRMLNATGDGRYAEILEKTIFNGILSGISISGDKYFYQNYLEANENTVYFNRGVVERKPWFDCACCPTNFCRFIPEILQYVWSECNDEIRLNLPIANQYESPFGTVSVEGKYPYDGKIRIAIDCNGSFKLSIRIPQWCKKYSLSLNGKACNEGSVHGYVCIQRQWQKGDVLQLELDMPVQKMRSNIKVLSNAGRIALMRGPLVYALETTDNQADVTKLLIAKDTQFRLLQAPGLPDGTIAIEGNALQEKYTDNGQLYFADEPAMRTPLRFTAIPYFLWQNRGNCDMSVWIRSE